MITPNSPIFNPATARSVGAASRMGYQNRGLQRSVKKAWTESAMATQNGKRVANEVAGWSMGRKIGVGAAIGLGALALYGMGKRRGRGGNMGGATSYMPYGTAQY